MKYLISFNDGDMQFPIEDLPQVGADAHAVMKEAIDQGVWVFGGGFEDFQTFTVNASGNVSQGALQPSDVHIGGFAVVDVDSESEAIKWAAKIAKACRCTQEVRLFLNDPQQDEWMRRA